MKNWRDLEKPEKRSFSRWHALLMVFLVVLGAGIGLCFTSFPGKLKRGLKELMEPRIVEVPADEQDIRRQIESRLRSEMEIELQREMESIQRRANARVEEVERTYKGIPEVTGLPLGSVTDVRKLRSGIPFVTEIQVDEGGLASAERVDDASYAVKYQLQLTLPSPARTVQELEAQNPGLAGMLPGLDACLQKAQVSPWFDRLYRNKAERIQRQAHTLNELLTKHNLYDCETMLEFEGAGGQKVFLMQAEMDVVSDGSDGDRLAEMPDEIVNSTNYQPFTSYGWPKQTKTPNPMVAGWKKRVEVGTAELKAATTSAERKIWLKDRIAYLKRGIEDMKSRSFLIAEYDPFIVIPVNLLSSSDASVPKVGDYGVVIHGGRIYPVIVGDGGPSFKVGEASLRMARELNPKSNPYSRPVSDLKVTYLVFPGSRDEKKGPPDYVKWRDRCAELLKCVGGLAEGYELHLWEDLIPKPEPAPETPTPAPADAVPAPSAAPAAPPPAGSGR